MKELKVANFVFSKIIFNNNFVLKKGDVITTLSPCENFTMTLIPEGGLYFDLNLIGSGKSYIIPKTCYARLRDEKVKLGILRLPKSVEFIPKEKQLYYTDQEDVEMFDISKGDEIIGIVVEMGKESSFSLEGTDLKVEQCDDCPVPIVPFGVKAKEKIFVYRPKNIKAFLVKYT